MNEVIEGLKELEASMVKAGVTEEYGSWLLAVRLILANANDCREDGHD
jgi:hypothetical protein